MLNNFSQGHEDISNDLNDDSSNDISSPDRSDHKSQQIESSSDVEAPDEVGQNVKAQDEFEQNVAEKKKVLSLSRRSKRRVVVHSRYFLNYTVGI